MTAGLAVFEKSGGNLRAIMNYMAEEIAAELY
jgi:hypothetical protein